MAAGMINGQLTVNDGTLVTIVIPHVQHAKTFEVMGPGYSTHLEHLVCRYFPYEHKKVMIYTNGTHVWLSRFHSANDLQPYWSTRITIGKALNLHKYHDEIRLVLAGYDEIFGH